MEGIAVLAKQGQLAYTGSQREGLGMTDCVVRLGLAVAVIVMITAFFYGYGSPRAVAIEPPVTTQVVR